jgi:hypothetical protein
MIRSTYGAKGENTYSKRKSQGHTAGFMRTPGFIAILVLTGASLALSQDAGKASRVAVAKHAVAAKPVDIISPTTNQTVEGTAVEVRYETSANRRASARPANFRIQLDSQPPVETGETSYTFENVNPGSHAVRVELIGARDRSVAGSQAISSFILQAPKPNPVVVEPMLPPTLQKVAMFLPQAAAPLDSGDGSGEMPLLSAIGLGVLVGGMVSAMKTRA